MRSYRVSTSNATSTNTATTSVSTSGISQPESAAGQRQPGPSFTGIPTTVHIPESTDIPSADQYAGLSLLAEASVSRIQVDPFEALAAAHRTVTFGDSDNDEYQEQPDDSSILSNEPSQPVGGSDPILRETPFEATLCISLPTNSKATNTRTMTSISEQEIFPQ